MTDNQIYEELEELGDLLTERIVDLAGAKGGEQARHAYIYYRSFVYRVMQGVKNRDKQSNTKAK